MMQWPRESGHCGNNTHGTQTLVALPSSLSRPFPRGPSWFPQIWPETCPPHFFLLISDKRSTTGLPVGSIIGIALGVLIGVALMATLAYFLLCTRTGRASAWHDLRQLWHPASTPCHAPVSSSTSPASLPSPTKEVPIYQELQHPDTSIYCQINHKAEVAS